MIVEDEGGLFFNLIFVVKVMVVDIEIEDVFIIWVKDVVDIVFLYFVDLKWWSNDEVFLLIEIVVGEFVLIFGIEGVGNEIFSLIDLIFLN